MYIPEHEVRANLTYEQLIPAIRQALVDFSAGLVDQPPQHAVRVRATRKGFRNGWFAVMPVIAGDYLGVKTVTFYPGNAELGLHTHMAVIELLRRATGEPLAVMDGRLITEMRTAAASAVALDALASDRVTSLGILGSGVQARSHLRALGMVRPGLKDLRIWSRTKENADRLAHEVGARSVSIEEAAAADVVLTATSSTVPVLEGRWLAPNAVVLSVGATGATVRELDDESLLSSWVVADSRAAVERESGDVRLSGAKVQAEIGEILADPILKPCEGRILFKAVGLAIEDLVGARLVWESIEARKGRN